MQICETYREEEYPLKHLLKVWLVFIVSYRSTARLMYGQTTLHLSGKHVCQLQRHHQTGLCAPEGPESWGKPSKFEEVSGANVNLTASPACIPSKADCKHPRSSPGGRIVLIACHSVSHWSVVICGVHSLYSNATMKRQISEISVMHFLVSAKSLEWLSKLLGSTSWTVCKCDNKSISLIATSSWGPLSNVIVWSYALAF